MRTNRSKQKSATMQNIICGYPVADLSPEDKLKDREGGVP